MAFKQHGGGNFPPTHNLEEDGPLVGTYVETREVDLGYKDQQGNPKPKKVHTFSVAGGAQAQLWGSYRIDDAVETVKAENPPPVVRFTHQGKTRTANGNTVNNILVEISDDPEDAELLSPAPAGSDETPEPEEF